MEQAAVFSMQTGESSAGCEGQKSYLVSAPVSVSILPHSATFVLPDTIYVRRGLLN